MSSAQSAAFASVPGYVQRPTQTTTYGAGYQPLPTLPALPNVPNMGNAPYAGQRQMIANQLSTLPAQEHQAFTGLRDTTKLRLAGYGGYSWGQDDPNTAQDESLNLSYDANKGMGQREIQALHGAQDQANAAGLMASSFALKGMASAVQRTQLEGQQIANQYAGDVNNAAMNYANQGASLVQTYAGYFGQDATWALQNPPPTPDPTAGLPTARDGSTMVWHGTSKPNLTTLQNQWPGYQLGVRKAGDGSYVVVIGQGNAAAAGPAPSGAIPGFHGFATNVPKKKGK